MNILSLFPLGTEVYQIKGFENSDVPEIQSYFAGMPGHILGFLRWEGFPTEDCVQPCTKYLGCAPGTKVQYPYSDALVFIGYGEYRRISDVDETLKDGVPTKHCISCTTWKIT